MRTSYDIIVIGGGHAGTEAAWAAASALCGPVSPQETPIAPDRPSPRVALVTMDPSKIGAMSCNPAIGGLAKGQIVREIDALGGLMGLAADATGIMFKMLNTSKGAAVRGPRAQCDKYAYAAEVQRLIALHPGIEVIAATVDDLLVEQGRVAGVVLSENACVVTPDAAAIAWNCANAGLARPVYSRSDSAVRASRALTASAVVLTTGTFMRALMHTGEERSEGGRVGEGSAVGISGNLRRLGFELGRLKTGTPPRLARESLDWEALPAQTGDVSPTPFSDLTDVDPPNPGVLECFPRLPQVDCRVTETTAGIHALIRENLHRAPMYSGQIEAECGPRYCPSIEDKVVRFADKPSHHVFLEPESLHTNEVYCNGISTSLPADVQERIVHGMEGCRHARILRPGYAVEYDMVWPHQIDATGMTKSIEGLFLAGQINGTSGYEEAGGQGLVAGLNAARFVRAEEPSRLGRDQAYIGVMMDDLVTKTPREPYRMFTSRAEHRLLLRADTADERLTPLGRRWGLVDDRRWALHESRQLRLAELRRALDRLTCEGKRLSEIARRPDVALETLVGLLTAAGISSRASELERVVTDLRYEGYVVRQLAEVKRQREGERTAIPADLEPATVAGLRAEAVHVLARFRPRTLGQAARLAGINPADVTLLAVAIRRHRLASADA
jgi:tRNA uridine 5-carboxymethylaminomethyl modification enzyme